jgi:hypothetical protein
MSHDKRNNQHFQESMAHLRNYRLWVVKRGVDPWVSRQALVMTLELDTIAATDHGVKVEDLEKFDVGCREMAKSFAEKEGRSF